MHSAKGCFGLLLVFPPLTVCFYFSFQASIGFAAVNDRGGLCILSYECCVTSVLGGSAGESRAHGHGSD